MIYLIGVEHEVQSISVDEDQTADQTKYRLCLEQAIEKYKPTAVAEEFSEDARCKFERSRGKPQDFLTRRIANARGIRHLLCDTDRRTKNSMGYQGAANWEMDTYRLQKQELLSIRPILAAALEVTKEFHLRENYWLERLKDVLQEEVVFVCGDYHVDTFGSRLKNNGIESRVVARQIGMPTELIEKLKKVKVYIEQNAQHIDDVYQEIQKLNAQRGATSYTFDDDEAGSGLDVV